MNTDELVALLAKNTQPVGQRSITRQFAAPLAGGALATALLMVVTLGVRADIGVAALLPMFWVKLGFPLAVALAAYIAVIRLARPGQAVGRAPAIALVVALSVLWLLALAALSSAAPAERRELVFGDTWLFCMIGIPLLSIPVFIAALWGLKALAPTRPAWAGATAGLLAGAVSAMVYALHCPELTAPFIAIWYVLGMLVPAMMGALIGPRLLRW